MQIESLQDSTPHFSLLKYNLYNTKFPSRFIRTSNPKGFIHHIFLANSEDNNITMYSKSNLHDPQNPEGFIHHIFLANSEDNNITMYSKSNLHDPQNPEEIQFE